MFCYRHYFSVILVTSIATSIVFFFFSTFPKEMSLEEKVGQLMMVHFRGEDINEDAKTLIQKSHIGGFIYYNWANGLNSPQQIRRLSFNLQELAKQNRFSIPLLIAVDQEGGVVTRLKEGFTIFPGNKAIAMTGDPQLSEHIAFAMGQELRSVGVNMNLSPVVDVNSRSPVIGIRSFGRTVDKVISFAKNTMLGYGRAGIITSLKHFPGHGDVELDSHEDLPVLNKTKEQLKNTEFLPFAALANQADIVMTAHIVVPAFDTQNCATLSKVILDYLQNEIGFNGVIMSDSLVMEGLLKNCHSIDEASIRALNAGCDLLLLGGKQMIDSHENELTVTDIQRIHAALVNAVRTGVISEERLNQAVQRVLDLKKRYALPMALAMENREEENILFTNLTQHQSLAQKTASLSLRRIRNKFLPPLQQCKLALFAPALTKECINQTSLPHLGKENFPLFFSSLNPNEKEIQIAHDLAKQTDLLVFCSYDASKNVGQAALIESLLDLSKPMILISLKDPFDATLFPNADLILMTFSPTPLSIQAAADELTLANLFSISVSSENANKIADKIWKNECAGTVNGLTCWNKGENFGSFGIGHFIWYPAGQEEKFEETFPELLKYIQSEGIPLPTWLKDMKKCPWLTREEFYQNMLNPKIAELRQFLFDTKALQASFIAKRLEKALPKMTENLAAEDQENVEMAFYQLVDDPRGLYALIDYLNFKGLGISPNETYNGLGWGLLQVLQGISSSSENVVSDFVEEAKTILTQRVQNSPPERNEKRWLQGWLNRVTTYLD